MDIGKGSVSLTQARRKGRLINDGGQEVEKGILLVIIPTKGQQTREREGWPFSRYAQLLLLIPLPSLQRTRFIAW